MEFLPNDKHHDVLNTTHVFIGIQRLPLSEMTGARRVGMGLASNPRVISVL